MGGYSHRTGAPSRSYGERLTTLLAVEVGIEDYPRDKDGGKQVRQQSEGEGDGKAAYRAGPEEEENGGGDDGGDVRINNGGPGVREALVNRRSGTLAGVQLFADALEDEHIGVDTHTDGEDDAGDTGKRKGGAGKAHEAEQDDQVEEQSQV